MQILCVIALLIPAMFDYTERGIYKSPDAAALDERLTLGVAVVLILVYLSNLAYTLVTHADVFAREHEEGGEEEKAEWSLWKALAILLGATVVVAVEADIVSGELEEAATSLGLTTFFLGIIVLPVVGNAAEYLSAVYFARQNRMGLAVGIAVGSSIQVALLTAPILVLVSYAIGHPMNLVFANPLELIAIAGVSFAVNAIAQDGETTWFEGVLLLAVYVLLGMAFYFATP
jgi:Ca2+:H+ antiporter